LPGDFAWKPAIYISFRKKEKALTENANFRKQTLKNTEICIIIMNKGIVLSRDPRLWLFSGRNRETGRRNFFDHRFIDRDFWGQQRWKSENW
jgi:hypothetical protein